MNWWIARRCHPALHVGPFVLVFSLATHAATITVESRGDQQPALILVDGIFEPGDGDQFRIKASPLSKTVVSFRSDGGMLSPAFKSVSLFD